MCKSVNPGKQVNQERQVNREHNNSQSSNTILKLANVTVRSKPVQQRLYVASVHVSFEECIELLVAQILDKTESHRQTLRCKGRLQHADVRELGLKVHATLLNLDRQPSEAVRAD